MPRIMIERSRARLAVAAAMMAVAAARALGQVPGKGAPRYSSYWLPDQGTAIAGRIDAMFNLILYITGGTFVLVAAILIWFLIRYRARPGGRARFHHGNTRLEILWTIIPAVIVVGLGFMSRDLWSQITQQFPSEDEALVIEVRPRQFQWDILYAGADGRFGTPDDVATINQLHVPAGRDVLIRLKAQDVIHSFFVPEFRIKQDAVPGMTTSTWFNAPKPGSYQIACAELCGLAHYRMRGYLTVHDPAAFDAWYATAQREVAAQLAPPPASGDSTAIADEAGK